MKPKGLSVLFAFITLAFTALFSSWLILEIVILVLVLSFAGRGVIWPKSNNAENSVWFGLFWGLTIGILGYPIWQQTGLIQVLPKLLGQV